MRKFKLDGTVFQDEYGKLSPNAFDVLNTTFGSYGNCELFKDAISLVSKNFSVMRDNEKDYEYDYTDENGTEHAFIYDGKAGLKLGFLDKLILGIKKGDINLALSGEVKDDSKI